jgi:hypothetical protein
MPSFAPVVFVLVKGFKKNDVSVLVYALFPHQFFWSLLKEYHNRGMP